MGAPSAAAASGKTGSAAAAAVGGRSTPINIYAEERAKDKSKERVLSEAEKMAMERLAKRRQREEEAQRLRV